MSFGFGIGDFALLTQLALRVVNGAREACGVHDELAREMSSLHTVLNALQSEVAKPNSILNSNNDGKKNELAALVEPCQQVLSLLEEILDKYNAMDGEKRSVTKLWKKIKFGGEIQDLNKIRQDLATHAFMITMFLNLQTIGSLGRVETHLKGHGEDMRGLQTSVNWILGSLQAKAQHGEGSILTTYASDDKMFWKDLRRELVKEGYSSTVLERHRKDIRRYVEKLGDVGALDDLPILDATITHTEIESEESSTEQRFRSNMCVEPPLRYQMNDESPTITFQDVNLNPAIIQPLEQTESIVSASSTLTQEAKPAENTSSEARTVKPNHPDNANERPHSPPIQVQQNWTLEPSMWTTGTGPQGNPTVPSNDIRPGSVTLPPPPPPSFAGIYTRFGGTNRPPAPSFARNYIRPEGALRPPTPPPLPSFRYRHSGPDGALRPPTPPSISKARTGPPPPPSGWCGPPRKEYMSSEADNEKVKIARRRKRAEKNKMPSWVGWTAGS